MSKPANEPVDVDTPTQPAQRSVYKTTADNPVNINSPAGDSKKPATTPTTRDNPLVLPDTPIDAQIEDDPVCVKQICLEDAYKFVRIGKFVARPFDAHTVRQAARNSFKERPKSNGYGEVELFRFQQWY